MKQIVNSHLIDISHLQIIKSVNNYKIKQQIDRGYFSKVYLAEQANSKQVYAVKMINKQQFRFQRGSYHLRQNSQQLDRNKYNQTLNQFKQQMKLIKDSPHLNIVEYCQLLQTINNIYIFTQYCNEGSIENIIHKQSLSYFDKILVMRDITQGFIHMAQLGIIHKDLTPYRILIKDGVYKISITLYNNHYLRAYRSDAPEVLQGQQINMKSNIWSLGVIFYRILSKNFPWQCKVKSEKIVFPTPLFSNTDMVSKTVQQQIMQMIKSMIKFDPNQRCSIYDVKQRLDRLREIS